MSERYGVTIEEQVARRREVLGSVKFGKGSGRIWGLALSGGGIRSATFCFGLLRALALNNVLLRIDIMSTVSGGGYIGAMLGRLFSRARSKADSESINAAVADGNSRWFSWWLRANGRYLTPRGPGDWTYAIALYLRSLVGIHFEFGLLALLLGCVLGTLNLWVWYHFAEWPYNNLQESFAVLRYLPTWLPVIGLAELPILFVACALAIAYWSVPSVAKTLSYRGMLSLTVFSFVLVAGSRSKTWHQLDFLSSIRTEVGASWRGALLIAVAIMLVDWLLAIVVAYIVRAVVEVRNCMSLRRTRALRAVINASLTKEETKRARVAARHAAARKAREKAPALQDAMRTLLTKWLAICFRVALIIAGVGLLDRAAWFMAFDLNSVGAIGIGLAVIAGVLRSLFPKLALLQPGQTSTKMLLLIGRILGYALTFLLLTWWVSLVYKAGLGALFQHDGPHFADARKAILGIGIPVVVYMVLTGSNLDFLNLSSLHGFYRARLIRSYLGATNSVRLGQSTPLGVIDSLPEEMPSPLKLVAVGDTQAEDDIRFSQYEPATDEGKIEKNEIRFRGYAPYRFGGPVHIINICVNQNRDPRGGLFNQDRRGLSLSVASGGIMKVGQQAWQQQPADDMTLGTWTAISGAAIAPGLGSLTRGGISALAFFASVRLGYWWRAKPAKWVNYFFVWSKSLGLLAETLPIFKGTATSNWFLTDGGHFENTGAYALLAERAELIILADCGADPDFQFCDLENLVRKARIDLQAEITFQRPVATRTSESSQSILGRLLGKRRSKEEPVGFEKAMAQFGSLNELASNKSSACLAFATIDYLDARPGKSTQGYLILVKPNIYSGLPVDLINFKAQSPAFPQETTADQWFSEAQWESYSQLGRHLGTGLTEDFIQKLIAQPTQFFREDDQASFDDKNKNSRKSDERDSPESESMATAVSRLPSRIASVTAKASLGIGVLLTVAISAWQGIQGQGDTEGRRAVDEQSALKELTSLWGTLPPTSPGPPNPNRALVVGNLAAKVLQTAGAFCKTGEIGIFQRSTIALHAYNDTLIECSKFQRTDEPMACLTLLEAANPTIQTPFPNCLVRYDGISAAIPAPHYGIYDYSTSAPISSAHPCDSLATARRDAREKAREGGPVSNPPICTKEAQPDRPRGICDGKVIFPIIYGAEQETILESSRRLWASLGAKVAPSENVIESARHASRAEPLIPSATIVQYSDDETFACAQRISQTHAKWKLERSSLPAHRMPGVIEVGVVPIADSATTSKSSTTERINPPAN